MFKALLRKQLSELLTFFVAPKRGGKPRSTGMTVCVILLAIAAVGMLTVFFAGMALSLCAALCPAGLDWMYFAIMGGISFIFGVFGSVFTAYNGLFVAKDNELLLSMPIKPKFIVFVRMLGLYIISFIFDAMFLFSTGIIYMIFGNPSVTTFIFFPISLFVLPLLSLTVSCVLGWILALILPHVKNKNVISIIVSVVFMGAYLVFCMGASEYMEELFMNLDSIAEAIMGKAYILYLFGEALRGEIIPFIVFTAITIVLFGALYFAISKTFLKLATTKKSGAKVKYEGGGMSVTSVKGALFKREIGKFFSSSTYVLNCGIGIIMILLIAVFAVIKRGELVEMITLFSAELPEILGLVPAIIAMVMGFVMSMVIISAPSVSLEGKTIWLAQSLPVRGRDVLYAKVKVHFWLLAPIAAVCAMILSLITGISAVSGVAVVIFSIAYSALSAYLGVVINLLMPKLEFTNETVAVKQSGSVMVTMFSMIGVNIINAILFFTTFMFIPSWITILGMAVIYGIVCLCMHNYLSGGGEKRFEAL